MRNMMKLSKRKILSHFVVLQFVIQVVFIHSGSALAQVPVESLQDELSSYLEANSDGLTANDIKNLNQERNKDISNAYENYFVAKKNVSIARSALNPINTGLILGVSLGATYLWAPIALNALLSLPTKIYNIGKNEALANAQYWYRLQARELLNTEAVKLYYDILTNEFILKSIDLEVSLYNSLSESLAQNSEENAARISEINGTILALQKESLVIHDTVIKERAALRTMLSYGPDRQLVLSQDDRVLTKVLDDTLDDNDLSNMAFKNSREYKAKYWIYQASIKNLKMVRWSLISINGLNFSYGQRVKIAKSEKAVAYDEMIMTGKAVKNAAVDSLGQLQYTFKLQEISRDKSSDSLNFSAGIRTNFENNLLSYADYIMTAVSAIRDYRSFVMAHYQTLGKIEDMKLSLGKEIEYSQEGVLDLGSIF